MKDFVNKEQVKVPGPGSYEPNKSVTCYRMPNFDFGRSPKRSSIFSKNDKPGPGEYDTKIDKSGPAFKIGEKAKEKKRAELPGPGNYEPNAHIGKDSVRAFKFANS